MFFRIDASDGIPIYEQISRQIKFAVASEALRPGEMIPSVRELARELAVNPNTVARAYRDLQAEGILEALRGTGMLVTRQAVKQCRADRIELLRQRIRQVFEEACRGQLALDELRVLVNEELARLPESSS